MPNKIEFKSFRALADCDYGVKGFEIRLQDMIEDYLKNYGIQCSWWNYYSDSIFNEVFDIYEKEAKYQNREVLRDLSNLYNKITAEVAERVEQNRPVTHEERIALMIERHPELVTLATD